MIRERPDVAAKREECRMAVRALKEALAALESLPSDLISRINGTSLEFRKGSFPGPPDAIFSAYGLSTEAQYSESPKHNDAQKSLADRLHLCAAAAGVAESEPSMPHSRRTTSSSSSQFVVSSLLLFVRWLCRCSLCHCFRHAMLQWTCDLLTDMNLLRR